MRAIAARCAGLRLQSRLSGLAVVTLSIFGLPAGASAADLQANPSNLASVFSSAQPGDRILLASGSYTFNGGSKSGRVTLTPQSGATPTMRVSLGDSVNITIDGVTISSLDVAGQTRDITISNSRFTGQAYLNMTGRTNTNILFDGNRFEPWDANGGAEGRLHITQPGALGSAPVGVTVSNNLFQGPGCSDGIQVGSYGVVIKDNVFRGIQQGSCGAHVDSVQLYGQSHTTITGNYFVDFTTAIMAPDGGNGETITNNVIDSTMNSTAAVQLGAFSNGSVFAHNTVRKTSVFADGSSIALRDNVMIDGTFSTTGAGCPAGCPISYNLFNSSGNSKGSNAIVGTPTFSGGANPTTYAGFALANGSPGKTNASDGTDRGINVGGGAPPTPDTTPPDTSFTGGPTGTTNDNTPTFTFTSTEAGSTFECRIDSGAWTSCTSPWTASALADGAHTASVRSTDMAGNTDASPATRSFTVDTTTPPPPNAPAVAKWTAPTNATVGQAVTLDGSASTGDAPISCTWSFENADGSTIWETVSGCTISKTFQQADTKYVRLIVTDGNGDTDNNLQSFAVSAAPPADTTPPDTSIGSGPTGTTNDNTPTFTFASTEAGSTFECRMDSGAWTNCTSPWTSAALADGAHTFNVRATDAAGNTDGSPAVWAFTVSTTAPPPVDTTPPNTTLTSGPTGATKNNTPTFAFSSNEGGSTFQCQVDSGAWASCTSPRTTTALADGTHTFRVRATDAAGNTDASPATRTFTVDTVAPNTTFTSTPATVTLDTSASVTFTSSEGSSTFQCRLDGGAWTACTSPYTVSGLALGAHTIAVRAIDGAGNIDATPASVSWTVVAPPAPVPVPVPVVTPPVGNTSPAAGTNPGTSRTDAAPTTQTLSAPADPLLTEQTLARVAKAPLNLAAPATIVVRKGKFALPCGTACTVRVTMKVGKRVVAVARGSGSAVKLTPAGKTAVREAGRKGLKTTVKAVAGSESQTTTSKLKLS